MDMVQSSKMRRQTVNPDDLVDYFECALHMKSAESLARVCQVLKSLDLKRGNASSSTARLAPKSSKVKRLYLQMDTAYMLYQQQLSSKSFHRYLLVDSSPQGGRDWLLSKALVVYASPLNLTQAARTLSNLVAQVGEHQSSRELDLDPSLNAKEDEQSLIAQIREGLKTHTLPPAALGLSHSNTAHKASALLHAMTLEVPADAFQHQLRGVLSVTGDLGVEIGIPSFSSPLQELMPTWRRQWFEKLVPDVPDVQIDAPLDANAALQEDGDFLLQDLANPSSPMSQDAARSQPDEAQIYKECNLPVSTNLAEPSEPSDATCNALLHETFIAHPAWEHIVMPFAMAVPGMLHISGNLLEDVTASLSHWRDFWSQLKNLASLITNQQRLNKFCAKCLDGVPNQPIWEKVLSKKLPQLYTERWGVVTHFLRKARHMIEPLQKFWNATLYGGEDGDPGLPEGHFSPAALSQTLRDKCFVAYWDMCLNLCQVLEDMGGWSEGCRCHPPAPRLSANASIQMSHKANLEHLTGNRSCPTQSLRAPEMANGQWQLVFSQLFEMSWATLVSQHESNLNGDLAAFS